MLYMKSVFDFNFLYRKFFCTKKEKKKRAVTFLFLIVVDGIIIEIGCLICFGRGVKIVSKIIVLVGSMRKGGNTDLLAQAFAEGAGKKNEVEIVSVADYKVNPCIGCNSCFEREENSCFQKDDMQIIYNKLAEADVVVVASPVYFYGISAQLKAIIDRLHTPMRNRFKIKKLALLLVGAATLPELFDSIKIQYQLVLNFFKLEDAGMVLVSGVKEKGEIKNREALKEAYELGMSIE